MGRVEAGAALAAAVLMSGAPRAGGTGAVADLIQACAEAIGCFGEVSIRFERIEVSKRPCRRRWYVGCRSLGRRRFWQGSAFPNAGVDAGRGDPSRRTSTSAPTRRLGDWLC